MKKVLIIGIFLTFSMYLFGNSADIVINEVASTGAYEFIELHNRGTSAVTLDERWTLIDTKEGLLDSDKPIKIEDGTVIEAGGYLVLAPYKSQQLFAKIPENIPEDITAVKSFRLGSQDSVTLSFDSTIVDSISWTTSVNTIGRDPDNSNNFISGILIPTPGTENRKDTIIDGKGFPVINEICSKGIDYIELYNDNRTDFIFTGEDWELHDSRRNDSFVIPDGTKIPSKGYLVLYPDLLRLPLSAPRNSLASTEGNRFGFSERDTIYLRYKGNIVDMTDWELHVTSKGRFPDGSDQWDDDLVLTPGKENKD